jgi:hypothetical protein
VVEAVAAEVVVVEDEAALQATTIERKTHMVPSILSS